MGCGFVYYLVYEGWFDVVFLEKVELIFGFIWYVVGQIIYFMFSFGFGKCVGYNIDFYVGQFEEEIGQLVIWYGCGLFCFVYIEDEMDWLCYMMSVGCVFQFLMEMVGLDCICELYFYYNFDGVLGVFYILDDGYVDLFGVIQVLVIGVCKFGVKIICCCCVKDIK